MHEARITFETAKMADPLIDVQPCSWFYDTEGNTERKFTFARKYQKYSQSMMQRIFREIYNIDVEAYLIQCFKNDVEIEQILSMKEYTYKVMVNGIIIFHVNDEQYDTYEKALEAGIQNVLNHHIKSK